MEDVAAMEQQAVEGMDPEVEAGHQAGHQERHRGAWEQPARRQGRAGQSRDEWRSWPGALWGWKGPSRL